MNRAIDLAFRRIWPLFLAEYLISNASDLARNQFNMSALSAKVANFKKVPGTGLEPARLAVPGPKPGASTNSAIPAMRTA